MELKNNILAYMKQDNISIKKTAKKTGINLKKLEPEGCMELNAAEICALCSYLDIRPEDFYQKKIIK